MKTRGFTLVEVLVVITIIAVLAALLFPAIAQAREKARQTTCLSNVAQISKSILMYLQDHRDILPDVDHVWDNINVSKSVCHCPNAALDEKYTYGFNEHLAGHGAGEFPSPSRILVVADSTTVEHSLLSEVTGDLSYRHRGTLMGGFLDGHCESLPPSRADIAFIGDRFSDLDGFYLKFGFKIIADKKVRLPHHGEGTPVSPKCPHEPGQRPCGGPYTKVFINQFVKETSYLPTHFLHRHPNESPMPVGGFEAIYLLDDIGTDYMVDEQGDGAGPFDDNDPSPPFNPNPHKYALYIDIDSSSQNDIYLPKDDPYHYHSSLKEPHEMMAIIFASLAYLMEERCKEPIIPIREWASQVKQYQLDTYLDMGNAFADMYVDPSTASAMGKRNAEMGKRYDLLRPALERYCPEMDDEFWRWLTKVRDNEFHRRQYTPLVVPDAPKSGSTTQTDTGATPLGL